MALHKEDLEKNIKTGLENALCSNTDYMNSTVASILNICGVPGGNDEIIKDNTEAIIDVLKSQLIPVMAQEIATAVDVYIRSIELVGKINTNGGPTSQFAIITNKWLEEQNKNTIGQFNIPNQLNMY